MRQKKKYRYRERIFLNEDYENSTFVAAIVENSRHIKKNKEDSDCGTKLRVESPYGIVTLNFELDLPDQVKESLGKIRAFEKLPQGGPKRSKIPPGKILRAYQR